MRYNKDQINKKIKKGLISTLLFFPKAVGLIWLYKFLFNSQKTYPPKELLINWFMFLIIFILVLSLAVYTNYLRQTEKAINIKKINPKEMDIWGTIIFFAFIMSLIIIPFKIHFRKRRIKSYDKK